MYLFTLNKASTKPLTTSAERLSGTAGDDTFSGSHLTLNAGDQIVGGAGTDTLAIFSGAASTLGGFSASGIEQVNVSASTGALTLDTLNISSGATLNVTGSSQNVTLSNISALTDLGLSYNSAGDVTFGFQAAATTGTGHKVNVATTSAVNGTVTIAGVETIDLTNTGTTTITALTTTAAETLNISGSGTLTLQNIDDITEVVNASAFTGSSDLRGFGAVDLSVTGGSGNDIINMVGGNPDVGDTINGGAGTDTLVIAASLTSSTAVSKVSNVEKVHLLVAAAATDYTIDADLFGDIEVQVADTNNGSDAVVVEITDAASVETLLVDDDSVSAEINDADDGVSITVTQKIGVATSADSLTVTMEDEDLLTVTAAGYENVTLNSNTDTNTIASLVIADTNVLTLQGSKAMTITSVNMEEQSTTEVSKVDASAMTAGLTITFAADEGDQQIIGGSGNDSITLADNSLDADDTITGGGGNDTLTVSNFTGNAGEVTVDVERLVIEMAATNAVGSAIDLRNSTSLNRVTIDLDSMQENMAINNIAGGTEVVVQDNTAATADVLTIDGTSGNNAVTVTFSDEAGGADFTGSLTANFDTVTLKTNDAADDINIALFSASTVDTLNLQGAGDIIITSATNTTSLDLIEASSMQGAVTLTSMARASAAVINTGAGGDSINLVVTSHANNVINAGTGTDTLVLSGTSTANLVIDLSNTTDQITSISGATNTAVQLGFENVTATSLSTSGINLTGSSVANTVVGSAQADTITAGSGALAVNAGAGADVITLGAAVDTVTLADEGTSDDVSSFTSAAGGDVIAIDVSAFNSDNLSDSTGTKLVAATATNFAEYTVGATLAADSAGVSIIKVTNVTGINAFADVNTAIDAKNITLDTAGGGFAAGEGILLMFYDLNDTQMVLGYLESDTADVFDDGNTFVQIATVDMSATNYTGLVAANFDFV